MKSRSFPLLASLPAAILALAGPATADWPTYRHNNGRTAKTDERLEAAGLGLAWAWRSLHPPEPAWDGAATLDAYHGLRGFADMRDYDHAFCTVAVAGRVYFGSTVDDSVRCLDAATGKEIWRFTTDGPVRVAPTIAGGNAYFGSDDGFAYCVSAAEGTLIWKFRPGDDDRRIVNNGRAIALRPCRTGVVVDRGTAYCAFSMLPWERSYLCALDALTGQPIGEGRYARVCETFSLEAPFAASAEKLFMPQGRTSLMVFSRRDGQDLGGIGSGGSYVVLAEGGRVLFGHGEKTGWIGEADAASHRGGRGQIGGARDMIVAGDVAYIVSARGVTCQDRQAQGGKGGKGGKWNASLPGGQCLALAADTLLAGGSGRVAAYAAAGGKEIWSAAVPGNVRGLTVAGGRLLVSTDEGHVYCFAPGGRLELEKPAAAPAPPPLAIGDPPVRLAAGPYVQFTDPDRAVIRWETVEPSATVVEYSAGSHAARFQDAQKTTSHAATLTDLKRRTVYNCTIKGVEGKTPAGRTLSLDTSFNYTLPAVADGPAPFAPDALSAQYASAAEQILAAGGIRDGVCLVVGCGEGRLAWELAKRSRLRVIGVDTDPAAIAAGRTALMPTGAYGARISLHHVPSLGELPLVSNMANLIGSDRVVAGQPLPYAQAEILRVLRPGGKAFLGGGVPTVKPLPEGTGVWSHQYGRPDNAAYGGEELAGACTTDQLGVQWVGRPGPSYQPDRSGRKPSPLAAGGRLFAQGLQRIIALDAWNGSILWSLEVPGFGRFNMPADCGNWCADADHLFAVVGPRCWQIEGGTGRVVKMHAVVPGKRDGWTYEWGYVGREGGRLVGSAIRAGSTFTGFMGSGGWYDAPSARKVCGDNLFALDSATGQVAWTYQKGPIIHPTITLMGDHGGRAYFIEGRSPAALANGSPDGGAVWSDQFMVALDLQSGRVAWEKPFACPGRSSMYSLAWSAGKLVLMTNTGYTYHVYGFDAADGRQLWHVTFGGRGDHGAHMSRPAIIDGKILARPKVIDLATGKFLGEMPSGGCGTYSASRYGAFFRALHSTMWSFASGQASNWRRLRPDCWLSTVPGCGLVLSPEASGGCFCGNWMETSVAFAPKTDVPVFETADLQFTGTLEVKFRRPLGGGEVHYTLDGSQPTAASPRSDGPVRLTKSAVVRACVVRDGTAGKIVSRGFEHIESKLATALMVNFQPPGAPPPGCVADCGEPFGVRPGGYAYGWSQPMKDAVHARGRHGDRKLDTIAFFMPGVSWSIAVENGTYDVTVSVGDPMYRMPDATIYVNGVEFCKGLGLGQEDFRKFTKQITVTDGRLKMYSHQKSAPVDRTRVNWIEIRKK